MSLDANVLAWAGVIVLMIVGVAGTILPALPGAILVLAAVIWGAWLDGYTRVPLWVVVLCGVLALAAWATDYVAAMLGAKRVRASGWALAGAAIGTVVGVFTGFVGLLFMPFVGAMAGEWWALRSQTLRDPLGHNKRALEVGFATWVGLMIGTAVKLALVFLMIGAFALAYFF